MKIFNKKNSLNPAEKKLTLDIISLCIAIVSLCSSVFFAWYYNFRPAKVVGSISYLTMWCFSDGQGQITSRKLTPSFWLENVGACPVIIEDVRLRFKTEKGLEFVAYPNSTISFETTENFKYIEKGGLFLSFILDKSQKWVSSYEYSLHDNCYENLIGNVEVFIDIIDQKNQKWITVINDILEFGLKPFHLSMIRGCRSEIIPIYTKKWKLRMGNTSSD